MPEKQLLLAGSVVFLDLQLSVIVMQMLNDRLTVTIFQKLCQIVMLLMKWKESKKFLPVIKIIPNIKYFI